MAKVYLPPEIIKVPLFHRDFKKYEAEFEVFEKNLKSLLKKRKPGSDLVGEIISFPVADGKALYMVAGLKPVELVHLPYLDRYHFEYAHRLTASDVREKVRQERALDKLFGYVKT